MTKSNDTRFSNRATTRKTMAALCLVMAAPGMARADDAFLRSAKIERTAGSVVADGQDKVGGRIGQVSGFLEASESGQGVLAGSGQDRSNESRSQQRSTQNARITKVKEAAKVLDRAMNLTIDRYAIYEHLNTMTADQIDVSFPRGDHLAHLQQAARDYNAAVLLYRRAQERLEEAQAELTGGQALSGSALAELNALLGQ